MEHRVPPRVQPIVQPRSLKECSGRTARMATEDSGRRSVAGAREADLPRDACQRPRLRAGDAGARLPGGRMVNDLSAFDAKRERQICDLRIRDKTEAEVCQMLGCTVPDIHRALD